MALPASITEFVLPPIEEVAAVQYDSAFQPLSNDLHNQAIYTSSGTTRRLYVVGVEKVASVDKVENVDKVIDTPIQLVQRAQPKLKKVVDPLEGTFITRVDETGTNIVYKYVSGKYERKCMVYECIAVAKEHGKCSKHKR